MEKVRTLKIALYFLLFILIPSEAFSQKLLDPFGSGGPISIVTATAAGVNSSVAIAYSVRQLKTTYDHTATITPPAAVSGFTNSSTPLMRVRRSTDNGQLDIGYDGSGNLDTVTLKNFVTNNGVNPTANGFVTVWYDQSGNSRDAYQTNTSQQFKIVNAGSMERSSSGQVGFGGVSGGMLEHQYAAGVQMNEFTSPSGINIYGIDSNRTLNVVSQPKVYTNGNASDGAGSYLIDRNGSTGNQDRPLTCLKAVNNNWTAQIRNLTGNIDSSFEGSVAISTTRSDNVTLTRTGNVYSMYVNGVLAGSKTLVGENKMTPVRVGYGTNTGENVYYGEFTLFPSSLSSNDLSALNTSQGSYFVLGTGDATWTGTTSTAWATGTNWNTGVVPDLLTSVTIPSGTSNSPTISSGVTIKKLTIASSATLTNNSTLTLSDSLIVNGTLTGSGTVSLSGGIKQVISGTTSPITFTNLTVNNLVDTVVCNNNINVSGTLTVNASCEFSPLAAVVINNASATGTITGSGTIIVTRITGTPDYQNQYKFSTNTLSSLTVNYGGAGAQNINLGINHGNLAVSGTGTKTLSAAITSTNVTGNLTLLGATLDNGGFAIAGASGKTFTLSGNSTLNLSGTTSAFPTVYTISLGSNSTVTYSGSGSQTISAQSYGNLTSSGSGARVLASSGTIGVANTFTPGSNIYTITGSTIDFNGTGAQTINAINYNNLTISGTRTGSPVITLTSGTVNVAATLSITATGVGSYAVTGNTVNYSGSAQTVASAITYNNLTLSGSGIKTNTSITVNGVMSLEGTATVSAAFTYGSAATLQYNKGVGFTSGLEWPSTFGGSGGVIISNTGTITFSAAKIITYSFYISSGASVNLGTFTTSTADALFLAGIGQVSGSWGSTASTATNKNSTYFGASATGRITIAGTTATWTGATSTAWGTSSNWSTNSTPTSSTSVVIPSAPTNQPSITSTANCLDITIQSGATLTSSSTLNVYGDFTNSGTTSWNGSSTVVFIGTGTQNVGSFTSSGAITISNTSSTVNLNGTVNAASLTFTSTGSSLVIGGTLTLSGALTLNNAAGAALSASMSGSGTLNCASIEIGNGTAAITNTTTFAHTLTSTVTTVNVTGNINIRSYFVSSARYRNGVFAHTSGTVTVGGSMTTNNANATNSGTYTMGASSPVLIFTGATPFSLSATGTSTITLNGTGAVVNYKSASAQSAIGGSGISYTTIKVNNTAGVTLTGACTIKTLTIGDETATSIFSDGGFVITPGTGPVLNLTSGTYNLGSATVGTSWPAWTTANISAGTTVAYVAAVAQSVSSTPSYKNLVLSGAGAKTIATATTLTVGEGWDLSGGTTTLSSTANATITGNITGSGAITMGSGTISVTGSWSNNGTFNSGTGTVTYNGTGAQTIAALNYTNLTVSGSRTGLPPLTLAAGTIGVSGTFTFTATGFNGYTTTGNTLNYNGTGSQAIALINYNDLTISGTRTSATVTLPSGTISIGGTFTVSATGTSYTTTGNTIDYNGPGAQTITPFSYTNLSLSGTRSSSPAITLGSGSISVSGTFVNNSTGIGSYVTIGNTFTYNGTGAQTIESIDYNNLTISTTRIATPVITFDAGTIGIAGTFSITATGVGSYSLTGTTINYNASAGSQNVLNDFTYNNLTLNNTSGTNTVAGAISVTGTFTTTAGGTINMGTNAITAGAVNHAGILSTQNTSSLPIPSGMTWGGTINFNGASQTIPAGTYNTVNCLTSGTKTLGGNTIIGGTLTLTSAKLSIGAATLTLNGDLSGLSTNNTLVGGTSSNLIINGSGALSSSIFMSQVSSTEKTLNQFTFNRNSATLTLADSLKIASVLTPTAGTLTTNGYLIIGSDASGTANVLSGSGSISGNVRVQRFIPSLSTRRWRFMASPVSGATLNDWKNEIHITGNGSNFDVTSSNYSGFYSYNEAATGLSTNGWVAATDGSTTPLTNGKGFRVFVRGTRNSGRLNGQITTQDNVTLDVTGSLVNTDVAPSITYTASGGTNEDGWNLIGNPYASAFDWGTFYTTGSQTGVSPDLTNVGRYAHINPVIYMYDATTNSYASYNANSGIAVGHLTGGIIPSGAAFFVQATNSAPSLTLKESNRVSTSPGALFKLDLKAPFKIRMVMDDINSDELVIKYLDQSVKNKDGLDIPKMYGAEVNIGSITPDGNFLSADVRPFNGISDTIPLSIGIKGSGNYRFDFLNVNNLLSEDAKSIGLLDKYTSRIMDLRSVNSYDFTSDINNAATFGNNRFAIIVGQFTGMEDLVNTVNKGSMHLYPSITHDVVNIQSNHLINGQAKLKIMDVMGNTIQEISDLNWFNNSLQVNLSTYNTGVYLIQVESASTDGVVLLRCVKQ